MIQDLLTVADDPSLEADVAIVGAGIAGLLLADRLRKRGKRVIVLETGSREQTAPQHPLNEVEILERPYRGATLSRFRCLGGTSTRWGGALIPFVARDLEARPDLGLPAWPVGAATLEPYLLEVERVFGLRSSPYGEAAIGPLHAGRDIPAGDADFAPRFAKWPRFAQRNVATLLADRIKNDPELRIWLNANVTEIAIDRERGLARGIVAKAPNGRVLSIKSRSIALCAGAIEATRLLLVLDRNNDGRIFADCQALGRYFHDHVSGAAGQIEARDPTGINRLAGFRFHQGAMRSLRFELTPGAQRLDQIGSSFVHIAARPLKASGFDDLREFLRSVQRRRPAFGRLARASLDAPYLLRAAQWRYGRRQLFWPQPSAYDVHIVSEQLPQAQNAIGLSTKRDSFGVPLASISWSLREGERRGIANTMRRFSAYWARHDLDRLGPIRWRVSPEDLTLDDLSGTEDIAHPMGSTRMGLDRTTSVLDGALAVHRLPNVAVAATSAFPSGSSANPTMMLAMLTLRLGDRLGSERH